MTLPSYPSQANIPKITRKLIASNLCFFDCSCPCAALDHRWGIYSVEGVRQSRVCRCGVRVRAAEFGCIWIIDSGYWFESSGRRGGRSLYVSAQNISNVVNIKST